MTMQHLNPNVLTKRLLERMSLIFRVTMCSLFAYYYYFFLLHLFMKLQAGELFWGEFALSGDEKKNVYETTTSTEFKIM